MVTLTDKALRYALAPSVPPERLMIERGIGYWISPGGEFVPVPPRVSHADVIRAVIDESELSDDANDAFVLDADAYAINEGWSRVRIYPGQQVAYLDFGTGKTESHRRLMNDLIEQLGLLDIKVKYTDEHGNYVSP